MYCVIQQVMLKKPNPYGAYKEIAAYQNQWHIAGDESPFSWAWEYTGGRFERPHLEAYKITLHQSYREGGKVKKRQYSVCTMSYYDICESWWGDCISGGERALAEKVGVDSCELYEIIEAKLFPLEECIKAEFHQSEEYKTQQKHEQIIADYRTAKSQFANLQIHVKPQNKKVGKFLEGTKRVQQIKPVSAEFLRTG